MNKTIIACRPGMQQQMEAAFAGVEVVVDPSLDKDYEFRDRALTLAEIMEEDLDKEERQEADPKNALTFVVPMTIHADEASESWHSNRYLAIRVENTASTHSVRKTIKDLKPTTHTSGDEVNIAATIGSLRSALKKDGYNVLSISEVDGIDLMQDA